MLGGVALIAVLTAFAYMNRVGPGAAQRGPRSTAAPVRVAVAERRDVAVVERTIGTVLANTAVQITARVQGVIDAAHFQEGQFVKTGDLLFQIDPRPYQAALAQAKAQLAKDEAQLENAANNEKRLRAVYEQKLTSVEQLDAAVAATGGASASVASDRAAIDLAQLNLDYTRIRAPIDGKTGAILVQPGNVVATNATQQPLVTINQIQPIKVSFSLPQSDLPRIQ
ncbi:MAG TPA: efflux RND transporter periplasmic adaptor subunit, partial [Gammaproteobacteria bacterium]|nr:efflux RND transporter periplasmic adaptor subunit [Gammaproteobacteria bacterium]